MMRKKILQIVFIWLIIILSSQAQNNGRYKLTLSFDRVHNTNSNPMGWLDFEFFASSKGKEELLGKFQHGPVKDSPWWGRQPPTIVKEYRNEDGNAPDRIRIWSKKETKPLFGIGAKKYYAQDYKILDRTLPYINLSFDHGDQGHSFINKMLLMVHLELIPVSINLHYFYNQGQGTEVSVNRMLPDKDPITLKATKGFVEATYQWEYRIVGDPTWAPLPAGVSYSEGKSVVTLKGEDLMSEADYRALIVSGKSIAFRINAITDEARTESQYKIITLKPTLTVPHIVSTEMQQERCHNSQDASIYVRLDRALKPNETIGIARLIGNIRERVDNIEALDANNGFYIRGLTAGSYTFALLGTHSNGLAAYAQAPSHVINMTIAERPAITHSFTKKDVSCFAGTDGAITLTASGGTGRFKAHLLDASGTEIRTQEFSSTTTFSRLPAGQYTLKVYDSNDCFAKDGGGNELIHRVTLAEPSEAVSVLAEAVVSPLAYNSSDGSISFRASGGTPLANGYQVRIIRLSDGRSFTPTSVRPDGGAYIYTLSNISRGEYQVIVEDARFDALAPEDKNAPCGCRAKLDITLNAPPPLGVEVKESRFVSCHGDSNGEITAHAKGGKPHIASRLPYTYTWYKLTNGSNEELSQQTDSIARGLSAGQYQVKITDANNISILSTIFTLVQPEALSLKFKVISPNCSGGEGSIEALVTGGTAPYSYEWNKEGETNSSLRVNEIGTYFLRVTDSRGCTIDATAEVSSPDALVVRPELVHPSCFGASNGSIKLNISGGTSPYTIRWEDSPSLTTRQRDKLQAGEYVALISDAAGCTLRYRLSLTQPDELKVNLSEAFTLCKDQSRNLRATSNQENVSYSWLRNGQPLSETGKELSVSRAGTYRVIVTNEGGCTASAEVIIRESQTELPIDITAPSSVDLGAEIHVVNISQIKADRLKWHLPVGAVVKSQSDERLIFTMNSAGIYTVALEGYLGDCSALVSQRIEVLPAGSVTLPDDKVGAMIKQFLVTPNPTTGEFKVFIELREPQDFTLRLLSPTMVEMDKKALKKVQVQTFEYELRGNTSGVYTVELRVGEERSLLKVTKQGN